MRFGKILLACLLCVPSFVRAAPGTEGAAFLLIPIGGAPSAMGSAYTSLATDAYAPVINPGGLGFLDTTQLAGHHMSYLETSHYDFLSFVHPLALGGAFGVSAQYFGSGDMTGRDQTGALTGDFSAHYGAYTLAYGHALSDTFSLGFSGRWINAKIDTVSANAFAADMGALLKLSKQVQAGLAVSNIGNGLKFIEAEDPLPLTVHGGMSCLLPAHLLVSAEGAYQASGSLNGHFGTQWQPVPLLALRAGYRTDTVKELSPLAGFSTGVGLSLWGSEFSYTWLPYGDLGQTHSFALVLRFGRSGTTPNVIKEESAAQAVPQGPQP